MKKLKNKGSVAIETILAICAALAVTTFFLARVFSGPSGVTHTGINPAAIIIPSLFLLCRNR